MRTLNDFDANFALRRLPGNVRALLTTHAKNLFLAGGFIRAVVAHENINDIDLFASSPEYAKAVAATFADGGKIIETDNAYTIRKHNMPAVQIIHRWTFTDPLKCVESFDYTIVQAAIWHNGETWVTACSDEFYEDLASKRLSYTAPERIEEAGGSMLRMLKYYQRGYHIPLYDLSRVIARLVSGIKWDKMTDFSEDKIAKILLALLVEVDPQLVFMHSKDVIVDEIVPLEDEPGKELNAK